MKLSDLKLDDVQGLHMHYDESDALRYVSNQQTLDDIKEKLKAKFGDIEISINPEADWYAAVTITSDNWQTAHKAYCDKKAEWCSRYGCE